MRRYNASVLSEDCHRKREGDGFSGMDQSVFFLMLLLLGMAAYYSFILFPKQREFRKKQKDISALQIGDEVVTFGGIIGTIVEIDTELGVAHVEIAPSIQIRLLIAALMQKYDAEAVAAAARESMEQARLAPASPEN
jgi:preprotein translocase subunit YajC